MPANSYLFFHYQCLSAMRVQLCTDLLHPQTFLFTLIPCTTSLPSVFLASLSHFCPLSLLPINSSCSLLPPDLFAIPLMNLDQIYPASCQSLLLLQFVWLELCYTSCLILKFLGSLSCISNTPVYSLKTGHFCTSGAWSEPVLVQLPVQFFRARD